MSFFFLNRHLTTVTNEIFFSSSLADPPAQFSLSSLFFFIIKMLACQRIAFAAKRQIHTAPAILAESEGLFGKFNPWANKTKTDTVTPAQHTNEETKVTFNVKYEEEDDIVSWKRTNVLTDPTEIESTVKSVILEHVSGATETNWNELPIQDLETKFKVKKKGTHTHEKR